MIQKEVNIEENSWKKKTFDIYLDKRAKMKK